MRGGRLPTYFSPTGVVISLDAFKLEKSKTPDPYLIREYSNGKVSLQLRHTAFLYGARDIPKDFWKMFQVEITNTRTTDAEGNPLPEPKTIKDPDSKEFRALDDATDYYNKFLAKYTESHFDESTGELEEVGNLLVPPDPDKPTISESSEVASDFGSW